jgi:hypothetical protein
MYTPDENLFYFFNEEELIEYLKAKITNIRRKFNTSYSTAIKILNFET